MSNINLLPWRALHQARLTQRIVRQLIMVSVLMVAILGTALHYIKQQTERQQWRNSQLLQASTALDAKLAAIERVQVQERELSQRRDLIAELQGSRTQALRLFIQLPTGYPPVLD